MPDGWSCGVGVSYMRITRATCFRPLQGHAIHYITRVIRPANLVQVLSGHNRIVSRHPSWTLPMPYAVHSFSQSYMHTEIKQGGLL